MIFQISLLNIMDFVFNGHMCFVTSDKFLVYDRFLNEMLKEKTLMQISFRIQVKIFLERLEQNHIREENNSYMTYGFYAVPLQNID